MEKILKNVREIINYLKKDKYLDWRKLKSTEIFSNEFKEYVINYIYEFLKEKTQYIKYEKYDLRFITRSINDYYISIAIYNFELLDNKDHEWFIKEEFIFLDHSIIKMDVLNIIKNEWFKKNHLFFEKIEISNTHFCLHKGEMFKVNIPIKYDGINHEFIKVLVMIE